MVRGALWVLLIAGGCDQYRQRVKMDVFVCNPNSRTADSDCGDGFVCYAAAQAAGESVCVPACDPNRPETCPNGSCTVGGECLAHCSVADEHACSSGGSLLSCIRRDYSPSADRANDGVCLPVAFSCKKASDCNSPVFNFCTNMSNGQQYSPALLSDGSFCAQGNCQAMGIGCEPGSACIKEVLPPSLAGYAPDVCTPNCLSRPLADGTMVDECMVGFTCISTAFPQQGSAVRVCLPGYAGWLCADDLGCGSGLCGKWDVTGSGEPLRHCSAPCQSDDDCVPFQGGIATHVEPNAFNIFTCKEGECRSFASLFFTGACVDAKAGCALDGDAKCVVNPVSGTPSPVPSCPSLSMTQIVDSSPAVCRRSCTSDGDCATLTQNTHVKYSCVPQLGSCVPSVPYLTPCANDDSCTPGLTCQPAMAPDAPPFPICTLSCQTTKDCTDNQTLGGAFMCAFGQCTPRAQSGCAPMVPSSDGCLSGTLANGLCVSPTGWFCDGDSRCQSGQCVNDHCK